MTPRIFAFAVAALIAVVIVYPPAWAQESAAKSPAQPTEEITVLGTQDKIINDFVYSTVAPTNTLIGQLARWEKPICPLTIGLTPAFNAFVTARVKEVAAEVGAKVESKSDCKANLQIIVTSDPQRLLDRIRQQTPILLGSHYKAEEKDLTTVSHPVQAWYATATADKDGALVLDDIGDLSQNCEVAGVLVNQCNHVNGSRTNEGWRSEFAVVTVVVDINKIADIEIGAVADDVAMLALAQAKISDTCRTMPSISNLFAPDCDDGRKAKVLTPYDLAYLTALYHMNTGLNGGLAQIDLEAWMKRSLKSPK